MQFEFSCPRCNEITLINSDQVPEFIHCRVCGHDFEVPKKLQIDPSRFTDSTKLTLSEASINEMIQELSRRGHTAILTQLNEHTTDPESSEMSMLGILESSVMSGEALGVKHYLTEAIKQDNLIDLYRLILKLLEQRNSQKIESIDLTVSEKSNSNKSPKNCSVTKTTLLMDENQETDSRFVKEEVVKDSEPEPTQVLKEFSLKGDVLGNLTLQEFKEKYRRTSTVCNRSLPLCSDERPGYAFHELLGEEWHHLAGIVHGRVELPAERLSPTIAGIKTDCLIYQFLDDKLFQITGIFSTDYFHNVANALRKKFGPAISEGEEHRTLLWWSLDCSIELQFGSLRPREPAIVRYYHDDLLEEAALRKSKLSKDL